MIDNDRKDLMGEDECLLIIGSGIPNPADKTLEREEVVSIQIMDAKGEVETTSCFSEWGELGISSFVNHSEKENTIYLTTGSDLFEIDLAAQEVLDLEIPKLRGVHEISMIGEILWITNTYYDEVISYNTKENKVLERLKLKSTQKTPEFIPEETVDDSDMERINKFHCNQVFNTYKNELFALVHHVNGEQWVRRIAQKLIKSQGNGGVLNLRSGDYFRLGLKAPHSVRLVNNSYWVFDSGHHSLNVYDTNWEKQFTLPTLGWGRGGAFSEKSNLYFAGISATRKRYRNLDRKDQSVNNTVQVFDIDNKSMIFQKEIANIEQINNLYIVKKEFANLLTMQNLSYPHGK